MAMSTSAMMRSGLVSAKAAAKFRPAVLKETRAQPSKMAKFDHAGKDEGKVKNKGEYKSHEVNNPVRQADRAHSLPSKGGSVGKYGQVNRKEIDQGDMQKPIFPAGTGTNHPRSAKTGNTRMKGPIPRSGAQYGGGGKNTQ
jgi:hypothetical protein